MYTHPSESVQKHAVELYRTQAVHASRRPYYHRHKADIDQHPQLAQRGMMRGERRIYHQQHPEKGVDKHPIGRYEQTREVFAVCILAYKSQDLCSFIV